MRFLKSRLPVVRPGSFVANIVVLMSWGLAAQALNFVMMPLLTRMYAPGEFGIFAVFTNVSVLLGVVAAMRYEFAVVLPEDDRTGALIVWLSVEAAVLFAFGVGVVATIGGQAVSRVAALRSISAYLPWLALAVALLAAYNAQAYWAIRRKSYARLGFSKLIIAIATGGVQLGLAMTRGASTGALVAGLIVGQLAGMLYLAHGSGLAFSLAAHGREILSLARRYSHFPRYSALGSGLDGISQLIPVALITAGYGAAHGGQYALADRAMRMPSVLLGSSLAQVFYQRLATSRNDPQQCHQLLRRTWSHLAVLGLLPTLVALAVGPWLFATVFGARWHEAGEAARALAPGLFAYFVGFPTSNSIVVFERLGLLLAWQAAYVILVWMVFAFGPAALGLTSIGTLWLFSAALVLLYTASLMMQWHVVEQALPPAANAIADPSLTSSLAES